MHAYAHAWTPTISQVPYKKIGPDPNRQHRYTFPGRDPHGTRPVGALGSIAGVRFFFVGSLLHLKRRARILRGESKLAELGRFLGDRMRRKRDLIVLRNEQVDSSWCVGV